MSTVVKMFKPYTYANLVFAPVGTRHMGDIEAWGSAVMNLESVTWDSGEGAHITYGVVATDRNKEPGDAGWVIGQVRMTADVSGEVAFDEVLMRRMVDEFKVEMRNCVVQGQPLVDFVDGVPVFKCCVAFATV